MAVSNDTAALIGFACEAFFFGMFTGNYWQALLIGSLTEGCYTVLFVLSTYLMQRRTRSRRLFNRPIFIISIMLYFSCAAHFALEFSHFYNALVRTLCCFEVLKS
jgi:hypothetical protein